MGELICPYCHAKILIEGTEDKQETNYETDCPECGKFFIYGFYISKNYYTQAAPCLNGAAHEFKQIEGFPTAFFVGKERCVWCGLERVDEEANKAATKEYREMWKAGREA